ncbi:tetratricopeptide repeat protein [Streptomyces sp. NPDC005876]|uniref:tetratricopeptide repeat protein n=1 Tax=unclassified Streptomyces TaxID=2593676 RepID=UPI0033D7BA12
MARLSRDKKQDRRRGVQPLDVRVPAAGGGTVDGVPVTAAPGEEIGQAVLNRLQNLARAVGGPVLATVHDERHGYVLPLRVAPDGTSDLTGPPTPIPAPAPAPATPAEPAPRTPTPTITLRRLPTPAAPAAPAAPPASTGVPAPLPDLAPEPKPTPTPARGFDAVAEAVLGDGPITAPGDGTAPALLAEPTARINEAVRDGRTQDAARLAEETVARASRTLGPDHPEVLRLRELTAYIAYLSGDPDRALCLSLELARAHHRAGDAEAAYGNVQSAATAWRAVRDPERGLELGQDLIGLWSRLVDEDGPAAEDTGKLDAARARMERLTERARALRE